MIITCPNCQTRYQVAFETIGALGRKVQCAQCHEAWQALPTPVAAPRPVLVSAQPDDDRLFSSEDENGLDDRFLAEEREASADQRAETIARIVTQDHPVRGLTGPRDPGLTRKQQMAMSRRRDDLISRLPYAKVRRTVRWASAIAFVLLLGCAFQFRGEIVRQYPDLAGVYAGIGLPVNVFGLEFRDVRTVSSRQDGKALMMIEGKIVSVSPQTETVPQIVVTLVNGEGQALYEWGVAPSVSDLAPGDVLRFSTQLASPPEDAARVRLSFVSSRSGKEQIGRQANGTGTAPVADGEAGETDISSFAGREADPDAALEPNGPAPTPAGGH